MSVVLVAVAVALGLGLAGLEPEPRGMVPAAAQEGEGQNVDDRAHRLVERLGRLCRNYDFYFRHEFAKGVMRPVRCSRVNGDKTILVVYSFSDRGTKKAWLAEWGTLSEQRGAVVVRGKRWTVEVLDRRYAREVRDRL